MSFKYRVKEILILIFLFSACSKRTSSKIPDTGLDGGPSSGNSTEIIANKLITNICSSIKRCHAEIDTNTCMQNVPLTTQILSELNVSGFLSTYSALIQAEQNKQINIDSTNGQLCLDTISNVSCTSNEMTAAYQSSQPNNFSNSYYLLRSNTVCALIYSQSHY